MRESNWLQHQNGGLDRVTWESYRASILSVINNPNGGSFWRNYAAVEGFLNPKFVTEVEALLEHAPIVESSPLLTAFEKE